MSFSNVYFESNDIVLSTTEHSVEIKFPSKMFQKDLFECMMYESFLEKRLTIENLTKDCEEFSRVCDSLTEVGGQKAETFEHRFMKEFLNEVDFPEDRFQMGVDISKMLKEIGSYKQLEDCYKPALLGFLLCKYTRPKLFAAVLLDAMIREKVKDWQLDIQMEDGISLMDLYRSKKETVDKSVKVQDLAIGLSPPFKLDACKETGEKGQNLSKCEVEKSNTDAGQVPLIAADVLFSIVKEYTALFVTHLLRHSKEKREADMKAQSLQSLLLKLRASYLSLQADFEVALDKQVGFDLPDDERTSAIEELKRIISNEAKMKKEILVLRENSRQLDRDLNRTALENERLEREVATLQKKVKGARSVLNEEEEEV